MPKGYGVVVSRPSRFRPAHAADPAQVERDRGSARARGYSRDWDKASLDHRRTHPLCQYCEAGTFAAPRVTGASRVDHLYPQRRYPGVFWVRHWWVSSCDACDAAKQALEHQPRSALDQLALRLGRPLLTR